MRQILLTGLIALGVIAIAPTSFARSHTHVVHEWAATSAAVPDRYCLQGDTWGYPGNCQFSTFEQCRATASGTGAGCGENPQFLFRQQRRDY
jgi:hypothetical protein